MGVNDRVEVLCAAKLEGPGQSRWSESLFTVAALRRSKKLEVTASFAKIEYSRPRELWKYSSLHENESDVVELVRAIAADPISLFEKGHTLENGIKSEVLKSLFEGLKLTYQVDTTRGSAVSAGDTITVAMGRYLAVQIERGTELDEELTAAVERYFALAPFSFGYWAPYKQLFKSLESRAGAWATLAVALARIDGQLDRVPNVNAPDKLQQFVNTISASAAGPDTIAYMMRRGRRWLRRLGRYNPHAYVHAAASFLGAVDRQDAQTRTSNRLILSNILYGRGTTDTTHGRGSISLPPTPRLYSKRWDLFPKAWDQHIDIVRSIWLSTQHNADIQVWAYNVLRSIRQPIPALSHAGLQLALLGPSEHLRLYACAQITAAPELIRNLDALSFQIFLKFCSARQFAVVYPFIEKHSATKSIEDAVFAYISENGLPQIRRGALPPTSDKRSSTLLCFSLRFMRPRFNAADTYQLARYVGQTTKFKPVSLWRETFNSLPLKALVELRLYLPDLSKVVVQCIDSACRNSASGGVGDENIAAALTLSPSKELRELGWRILSNAGDTTIATVWNNLIAQAVSKKGLEALVEALRNSDRIERIELHASATQLLSKVIEATASADSKIAESLFLRLAARGASQETLETLVRVNALLNEDGWTKRPALLRKTIAIDPSITRLLWLSIEDGPSSIFSELHLQNRHLSERMVDVVDVEDIRKIGSVRANYLMRALRSGPSRLQTDKTFAVSCATCPHTELQQFTIAKLEAKRLVGPIFVTLGESGMPAALAAAERYVVSIKDREVLTKSIVTICDSGAAATRAIGLRFIESFGDRLDMNAVIAALTEHSEPDVTALVAKYALSGVAVRRAALENFDNRVLRTRRVGRQAKELVKNRLAIKQPEGAVSIVIDQERDDGRIQALLDMARGLSLRDREWALQQLARLVLEGRSVPQVQVSATT